MMVYVLLAFMFIRDGIILVYFMLRVIGYGIF